MAAFLADGTLRVALLGGALVAAAAACGAVNDETGFEAFGAVGQPMVVELGPEAVALSPLPTGASLAGERFEWTPGAEHEGEHVVSIEITRNGVAETASLRLSVAPVDGSIDYGGCECGPKPRPPRPRAEAMGVALLAAYWRRRRRAAVLPAK